MTAMKNTQIKALTVTKLDRREHKYKCVIPLSTLIFQAKVKSLFNGLNTTGPDPKVTFYKIPQPQVNKRELATH
jgi:hypothetical protein